MSLVLAILSFFSAVFLPGAILYKLFCKNFDINFEVSSFIVISFIFSLCFNFYLVYILVSFGIYTQNIIVNIFLIEILLFLICFYRQIKNGIEPSRALQSNDLAIKILFCVGVFISLYMLNNVFKADIFYGWDAVASWNRWGIEWANGNFVPNEGGYSQLYPMLLSLGYVASQKISSFQGIGVAIYWYFAFAGIVACIFLVNKDSIKSSIFGITISIVTYIVFFVLTNQFFIGYADMPVAMIILVSALCLLKVSSIEDNKEKDIYFYLILGAFAAGISTEIKQAGLFWCGVYIIGLFYLKRIYAKKIDFKIIWICIAIITIFSVPWIIIALYKKIYLNIDATSADYVMNKIFLGKGYLHRLLDACLAYKNITILFILSLFSLKLSNKIFGFFAIFGFLYFIFWGTHLSYDLRNLQGGLPLMIIALSGVVVHYTKFLEKIFLFLYRKIALFFVCFISIGLIITPFTQEKILRGEKNRKTIVDAPFVNQLIIDAFKYRGEKNIIFNNYYLSFITGLEKKYFKFYNFVDFSEEEELLKYAKDLKSKYNSIYVLLPNSELEKYNQFVNSSTKVSFQSNYTLFEY